jgi:hypothetical protein
MKSINAMYYIHRGTAARRARSTKDTVVQGWFENLKSVLDHMPDNDGDRL